MKRIKSTTIIGITVALALSLCFTSQAAAINYTWYTYNGHQYAVTLSYESWVAAEAEAVSQGGHLVTINDAAENNWVSDQFKDYYVEGFNYETRFLAAAVYIGYYLNSNSGSWEWISGEQSSYDARITGWEGWDPGPHAYLHTDYHVYFRTWNHAAVHTEPNAVNGYMYGVIERNAAVPEPATLLLMGLGILGLAGVRRIF